MAFHVKNVCTIKSGLFYRRDSGTDGRGPEEDRGYQGRRPGLRQGHRERKTGSEGSPSDL